MPGAVRKDHLARRSSCWHHRSGERFVNKESPTRAIDAPRPVRDIIVDARKASGRTEKQVNREYRRHMEAEGRDAPKSIMTKVRDKRRVFALDPVESRCIARALDIDPAIITRTTPVVGDTPVTADTSDVIDLPEEQAPRTEEDSADILPPRTYGAGGTSFSEIKGGIRFTIDMDLDAAQFDRLTLAIPAYMMRTTRAGGMVRCRADVPIFPYQAELIMRAIYGGR